jgi:hypothetical protein
MIIDVITVGLQFKVPEFSNTTITCNVKLILILVLDLCPQFMQLCCPVYVRFLWSC